MMELQFSFAMMPLNQFYYTCNLLKMIYILENILLASVTKISTLV